MKKPLVTTFIFSSLLIVLSACSSPSKTLSTLSGELTYKEYGSPEFICPLSTGEIGTVESGKREILGTIKIIGPQLNVSEPGEYDPVGKVWVTQTTCKVTLMATEINLDVDVMVIDFNSSSMKGHWILKKSQFSDGYIELVAN